jgi:hypothetical protein
VKLHAPPTLAFNNCILPTVPIYWFKGVCFSKGHHQLMFVMEARSVFFEVEN